MRKDIMINGVDCSKIFTEYGYSVNYKKINGKAGGTMLDGSTTVDVIAIKAVISFAVLPQKEEEMSNFIKLMYSGDYLEVTYFDIRENGYRTIETIPSEVSAKHLMQNVFGTHMWQVKAVSFTER